MAIFYIDPSQVTNGTGTLASPFNTWASVTFAAGNDYLQKRGTTFNGVITVAVGGSSDTARVSIGAYGDGDIPKINAAGQRWSVRVNTNQNFVTIRDTECYGSSASGVTNFGIYVGGTCANVKILNCHIHDVGDHTAGDCNGIWAQCADIEIDSCVIDNVPDDAIWVEGINARITNCRLTRVGTNTSRLTGDGIQINGSAGTAGAFYLAGNYIDHVSANEKQGVIVSSATSGSGGVIENNVILYAVTSLGGTSCIYVDQPGVVIRGNRLVGSPNGINLAANNTQIYGNVIEQAYVGISTALVSYTGTAVYNNTVISCTTGVYIGATDAATIVRNNAFVNCVTAASITATAIRSNNGYFGCTTNQGCIGGGCPVESGAVYTDPVLDARYRPSSLHYQRTGVAFAGSDFYGKPLYPNPNIGAVDDYATKFNGGGRTSLSANLEAMVNGLPTSYPLNFLQQQTFSAELNGPARHVYSAVRTLTSSASENLDLSGVLKNPFGETINLKKVFTLCVAASSTNTNDVLVGGAASNQFFGMFGGAAHAAKVRPGGCMSIHSEKGYAVTAGTGDLLKLSNTGAGSVVYTIVIIGTE